MVDLNVMCEFSFLLREWVSFIDIISISIVDKKHNAWFSGNSIGKNIIEKYYMGNYRNCQKGIY